MMWCMLLFMCFFFFKQKTAYEMRISDWSSDVCSSDLDPAGTRFGEHGILRPEGVLGPDMRGIRIDILIAVGMALDAGCSEDAEVRMRVDDAGCNPFAGAVDDAHAGRERSEEHTSELQSLMRNSYAVYCLKKKTKKVSKRNSTNE